MLSHRLIYTTIFSFAFGCGDGKVGIDPLDTGLDTGSTTVTVTDTGPVEPVDQDGDGFYSDEDCDDSDASINPDASELDPGVNGTDDDCNGWVDDVDICDTANGFSTIQGAIDGLSDGFLIRVCSGVWSENLEFDGREIDVLATEGPDVTTIDGSSSGSVAVFVGGSSVSVEGFTITNGYGDELGGALDCTQSDLTLVGNVITTNIGVWGGGLYARRCELNLQENSFENNSASEMGGGLYAQKCSGDIVGNSFGQNVASEGGGVTLYETSLNFQDNQVYSNQALTTDEEKWGTGGGGGGLWLYGESELKGNTFESNVSGYNGGGLYVLYSSPEVSENRFEGNISYEDGGGTYTNVSQAWFHHNEFYGNEAYDDAGGLRVYVGSLVVEDNLFEQNVAADDAGGMKLSHSRNTLQRNVYIDNVAGDAGGGLELDNETSDVIGSEFYGNSAYRGGGLHSWRNEGTNSIVSSTFEGNHSDFCGGAIEMDNNPYTVTLKNLSIVDNTSSLDGAAVCTEHWYQDDEQTFYELTHFTIINSLIANNDAADDGGGIYVKHGYFSVINSTMYGNDAGDDGGGIALKAESEGQLINVVISESGAEGIYIEESYSEDEIPSDGLTVSYSDVWGSEDEDYQGMSDPTGDMGNISSNPRFVDPGNGDFDLSGSSPCIDSGSPSIQDTDGSQSDMGFTGGPGAQ